MYKKIIFEIFDFELGEFMGLEGDFNHKRNAPTPTGVEAILEGFKFNGEKIDIKKAKEVILDKLIEMNEIDDKKGWNVSFNPSHSWSSYDDDGYAYSIYRVNAIVSKSIK